jgi:hypothetical protein
MTYEIFSLCVVLFFDAVFVVRHSGKADESKNSEES